MGIMCYYGTLLGWGRKYTALIGVNKGLNYQKVKHSTWASASTFHLSCCTTLKFRWSLAMTHRSSSCFASWNCLIHSLYLVFSAFSVFMFTISWVCWCTILEQDSTWSVNDFVSPVKTVTLFCASLYCFRMLIQSSWRSFSSFSVLAETQCEICTKYMKLTIHTVKC